MKVAYFDCFSGASGDMILGALLDAGLPLETLQERVGRLGLAGVTVQAEQATTRGIAGRRVEVVEEGPPTARQLPQMRAAVEGAGLSAGVTARVLGALQRLARAEARIHGLPVEHVHFHEVSGVDTLVDVVGAAAGLEALGVDEVYVSAIPVSRGWMHTRHGPLPVPGPAALELLVGAPLYPVDVEAELVTPTGAALLAGLAHEFGRFPEMRLEAVGYGLGRRELDRPNALRVLLGEAVEPTPGEHQVLLEANIDDLVPEAYDHVTRVLFAAGANDVYLTPILMKKGRPGVTLSVLGPPQRRDALAAVIFRETTTLGLREREVRRRCLEREMVELATPYGTVRAKVGRLGGAPVTASPEYEDCRRAAEATGTPLKQVYAAAIAELQRRGLPQAGP